MTKLLLRLFVKDTDTPDGRAKAGTLAGAVGIVCNLLLFLGKVIAGTLAGSVAIAADGWNNLSDAAASIVTLLGFRFSRKPADAHHPYGHARAEYLSGLCVAVLILFIGVELAKSSVSKVIAPEPVEFSAVTFWVLISSIAMKLWMSLFVGKLGRLIGSRTLEATSADSRNDVITTSAVLVSCLAARFFGVEIDGWAGLAVAVFILWSGLGIARETMSTLLGESADGELVEKIQAMVLRHKGILGIHDLLIHDYGPGRLMVSLHAEVRGDGDIFALHDAVDSAEQQVRSQLGCLSATIHMDPIEADNAEVEQKRRRLAEKLTAIHPQLTIHDFRMVPGPTHTNLIFDAVKPHSCTLSDHQLIEAIQAVVDQNWENHNSLVTIDQFYYG
jgi:cation diffusion facilitator family transporter